MNRDVIKYIAIITMTLNHISNIFLDPDTLLGEALLDIGYFTAVTMCYFLVEGYHYTHSKKKIRTAASCVCAYFADSVSGGGGSGSL